MAPKNSARPRLSRLYGEAAAAALHPGNEPVRGGTLVFFRTGLGVYWGLMSREEQSRGDVGVREMDFEGSLCYEWYEWMLETQIMKLALFCCRN